MRLPRALFMAFFVIWAVRVFEHTYHRNSGKTREERGSKMNKRSKKIMWGTLVLLLMLACSSLTVFAAEDAAEYVPDMYASFWALIPPVVAIVLALITKEVYSSLFIGILMGGIFYSNFTFEKTITHVFQDGIIGVLSDSYNVGILVFLVILGVMVCLMNKAGGSADGRRNTSNPESAPSWRLSYWAYSYLSTIILTV